HIIEDYHGHESEVTEYRAHGVDRVDQRLLRHVAAHQRAREGARLADHRMPIPELVLERRGIVGALLVELVEELERDLPGLAPFSHIFTAGPFSPGPGGAAVGHRSGEVAPSAHGAVRTPPSRAPRRPLPGRGCRRRRPRAPRPALP